MTGETVRLLGKDGVGVKMITGTVINIQRFSIKDGPGIRTVVFLKGCPLKCIWCDNPESQAAFPEVAHNNRLCNKEECGGCCLYVCPLKAISLTDEGIRIDRIRYDNCGTCIEACAYGAIKRRISPLLPA